MYKIINLKSMTKFYVKHNFILFVLCLLILNIIYENYVIYYIFLYINNSQQLNELNQFVIIFYKI